MEIEPFLIASTVKAVVGQRLVRRLCTFCRQQYTPDQEEVASINELFGIGKDRAFSYVHGLEEQAASEGVGGDVPISTDENTILHLWKQSPEGCEECNQSGFKGRTGIYESLGISPAIQKQITTNATSSEIQDEAVREGMITMQVDGLIKALRGITTFEEVLRVTREQ